ncbi:MAG: diacylglycerol kinase family protein [Actinomycetota bacterium]
MTGARRPERLLLVVNPWARGVTDSSVDVIRRALSADFELEMVETRARGHALEAAKDATESGADAIVVFSGDGTINEVVNAIAQTDVALGIIPGGATNVLARALKLPTSPIEATGTFIHLALESKARRVNLGSANGRFFAINCGAGLDASVMARVEEIAPETRTSHDRAALFAALGAARKYVGKRPDLKVRVGESSETDAVSVLIARLHPYAYFKNVGLKVHPRASLDAGLDVLSVRRLPPLSVPRVAWQMFVSGDLASNPNTDYAHDVDAVKIDGTGEFPVQIDGEYLGDHDSLEVVLVRDALWVVA